MNYHSKYAHYLNEVPTTEHWAIITGASILIPGDDRSLTHPGHGYPASTEHYLSYEVFFTEENFKSAVIEKTKRNLEFRAIHVIPTEITTTIDIKVK